MMFKRSKSIPFKVSNVLYENRYCDQEGFSVLICGGLNKDGKITNEVLELKIPSFEVKDFPYMVKPHYNLYLATVKSDILAIGDRVEFNKSLDESAVFAEVYSEKMKTWSQQNLFYKFDNRTCYCVSSFMNKLYLIGVHIEGNDKSLDSCCTYDINSNMWDEIADLNVARHYAECTVFEGKIFVTGGVINWPPLKSVEAYDC